MIPQSFIDTLLNQIDIVEVVGSYIDLKKAGANHSACCPFHSEKSPSFSVSQRKQFYHCFGCGAHGTAISFLMEYSGMGFVEAVDELARKAGLVVPRDQSRKSEARSEYDLCAEMIGHAAAFYRNELDKSATAKQYVEKRGLNKEIVERYGIGYAPSGWNPLEAVYRDYTSNEILVKSGMLVEQAENPKRRYDRFRDRLMFPIRNRKGKTIGFGGRVLGAGEPKYLNSPESPCFNKGRELYGYFEGADAIRTTGRALVVEGYMDVVALAQHGVCNAVATLGTATTAVHVQNLFRVTDRVIFAFDGDQAGRNAAWRALEVCLPVISDDKIVAFLFLPEKDDPDSYVRAHGADKIEELLDGAMPLSRFLLRTLSDDLALATSEGKASLLKRVQPYLGQMVNAPALRCALWCELADVTGLPVQEVTRLSQSPVQSTAEAARRAIRQQPLSPALSLFRLLAIEPKYARTATFEVERDICGNDGDALYALVRIIRDNPSITTTASIYEHQREQYLADLVTELVQEYDLGDLTAYDLGSEISGAIAQYRRYVLQAKIDVLLASGNDLDDAAKCRLTALLCEHAATFPA